MLKKIVMLFALLWSAGVSAETSIPVGPFICVFTDPEITQFEATCDDAQRNIFSGLMTGSCRICGFSRDKKKRVCFAAEGTMEESKACPQKVRIPTRIFEGNGLRCSYDKSPKNVLGLSCTIRTSKDGFSGSCDARVKERNRTLCLHGKGSVGPMKKQVPPAKPPAAGLKSAGFSGASFFVLQALFLAHGEDERERNTR